MIEMFESLGNMLYEIDSPDHLPSWVLSEIRDHDKTGCPGRNFENGRWGGLICTTCGK